MSSHGISRRQLIARSAATAAALGLSISFSAAARKVRARVDPQPDAKADNDTLNALLSAEYDAVATYSAGAGIIAADSATPEATRDLVTQVALHFRSQHSDHATALKKLIEDNAGTAATASATPKLPKSFPSSAATTTDVIKLAADKEKQAAYTYAQVMETISTQTAAKLVASIGAVEAQHFVVLHLLAEGLISTTDKTGMMDASLVVPAAFILDAGVQGSLSLDNLSALDDLLKLDAA